MDIKDPVIVYSLTNPVAAELLANKLRAEGIPCFLGGMNQASAVGLPGTIIQVHVAAGDADRAARIIENLEKSAAV